MRVSEQRADFTRMLHELQSFAYVLIEHEPEYYFVLDWLKRSPQEQARLVERGFSWTLKSKHLLALAADIILYENHKPIFENHRVYKALGKLWVSMGGKWGVIKDGEQVDPGHFEYCEERRCQHLKDKSTATITKT